MSKVKGVGFNLRPQFIHDFLDSDLKVPFVEVIVDNWLSPGAHHKLLEKVRERFEISFHCVGMNLGGEDSVCENYLGKIKELVKIYEPFHISDHLCFQYFENTYHHDLLPIVYDEKNLKRVIEKVDQVQSFFCQEILIENLSYYLTYKKSQLSEAFFLSEISRKTGAKILLDLNNIWINCKNFGVNTHDYFDKSFIKNVAEFHVAGAEQIQGVWIDTHGSTPHLDVLGFLKNFEIDFSNYPIIYEQDNNIESFKDYILEVTKLRSYL